MARATEISVKGATYPVVLPISPTICWELYRYFIDTSRSGVHTRGYAAMIGGCIPGLRPKGLPVWEGQNQAEYAQIMGDHLMGMGLSPRAIASIIDACELWEALKERVPVDESEVVEAEKNSSPVAA